MTKLFAKHLAMFLPALPILALARAQLLTIAMCKEREGEHIALIRVCVALLGLPMPSFLS
jgi:hypothetical protein